MNRSAEPDTQGVPADVAAMLLLLSRLRLDEAQKARARQLGQQLSDWPRLIALARQKFSLPFVFTHLAALFPEGVGKLDYARIKSELQLFTLRSLQVAAAQARFHTQVLAPLDVAHVYLKGPSLAAMYYGDLGARFARDVDVLVPRAHFATVVRRALDRGYKLIANSESGRFAADARDVRAVLRYHQVAQVLSPDNVLIEIHRRVDKNQGLFDEDALLAASAVQNFQGVSLGALPTDLLFVYVCYHSTRHTWSLLHWLADIDAMMSHPSFDTGQVLDLAGRLGMRPLVEACCEFRALSARLPLAAQDPAGPHARALLGLCLKNLEGGMEVELELRDRQIGLDLPFDWLLDPAVARKVRRKRLKSRFLPHYAQFESWPLPDALQWLYLPTKPLFWLKWHLTRRPR